MKYNDQGQVIAIYHVKGNQPVRDDEGVSFFIGDQGEQRFMQLSGNVGVIEVTGNVQATLEQLGIKGEAP